MTRQIDQLIEGVLKVLSLVDEQSLREPATLVANMENATEGFFDELAIVRGGEGVLDFIKLMAEPDAPDKVRNLAEIMTQGFKKTLGAEGRHTMIMTLIGRANTRIPFSPLLAFSDDHPKEFLVRMCNPYSLFDQIEDTTGETKARNIVLAFGQVAESIYRPYVEFLLRIEALSRGEWQKTPKSYGACVNMAAEIMPGQPGLIDPDAAWIRNASAHNHWQYLVDKDEIELWDSNTQPQAFPADVLFNKLLEMYWMAGPAYLQVQTIYTYRDYLVGSGLVDEIHRAFACIAGEGLSNESVFEEVSLEVADKFRQLKNFMEENKINIKVWPLAYLGSPEG